MFPPQGIAALLKEALVVYKGTTDAAGGAGGTTLKCSDLATKADWNGNQIIVTSGDYEGQARDINGATTGGTVTPANAFGGQIVSGVTFVITGIRTVPAEVAECLAILESDSRRILSTALTAPTVSSLTKFIASGGTALGEPLPASTSLVDLLGNFTGPYNGAAQDDNIKASLDLLHTHTGDKSVGKLQLATTTEDLNQVAASYDLFTGTAQSVILEKLTIRMPTEAAGGSLTSITIQTDDATPAVIINSTDGAVANLTSEAQLAWIGAIEIPVGTKIQLTIAGGAHGSTYTTTIVAQCRAVVAGGYLS